MPDIGTTKQGFVNCNGQVNLGQTNPKRKSSGSKQYVYVIHCPCCIRNLRIEWSQHT